MTKSMTSLKLARALGLIAALATVGARAEPVEETLDDAGFGKVTIYRATDEPKGVLLFAPGTGGWSAELTATAKELAQLDYVVSAVNPDEYLARLERSDSACVDLSADFDRLNRALEARYPIETPQPPVLLGYGAGASLVYAALAQAPAERFHAGVGVDFCPELALRKPLCPGPANLAAAPRPDNKGVVLKPVARLPTTWFVFQNRPACAADAAETLIKALPLARLTTLSATEGVKAWLPQVSALLQWLDPGISQQVQPDASATGVPLIEVPVAGGPERPQFAVMLSGDGGWALLDRAVTAELAQNGLPTVGWDSLSYFWKARQPDAAALDLERVLRHYLTRWKKSRIVLMGYSFGADVLPAMVNRLPQDLRERVDLVAFMGLSDHASFEFNLTDWISDRPDEGDQPIRPELEKMSGLKRLCVYGAEEEDAACPKFAGLGVIAEKMPGDHHFDEDYQGVARRILDRLPPPATAAAKPPGKD
ncbi:MAG: virulence factor family protein [Candidatus Competibacteraceae bacterium]|nr:virulence factor family protein [Candidatus Competibacteraceae bacterium]